MGKPKLVPKKKLRKANVPEIEFEPDAMERFERAIGVMAPARRKKAASKPKPQR